MGKKRTCINTYAESENGRRPGALLEVPLKSRKKRKQDARKKTEVGEHGPVFEEPVEDGEAYAFQTSNSQVSCPFSKFYYPS